MPSMIRWLTRFGPLAFTSKQDGGYAELAYRPISVDVDFVRNLELIFAGII